MMTSKTNSVGNLSSQTTASLVPQNQLSLAVISLNEAQNIERCLRSVPFASDVVVVDSGSTDKTVEIAERCGARVVRTTWRGFRDQKRYATEQCKNQWVLSLDADEALSPEAASEIQKILASDLSAVDGFEFPRLTWNLGRWIRFGGWTPDRQLRLYHRDRAQWQGGEHVHERVEALRVRRLIAPILHWPFPNLAEQVATNNCYSGLGAAELQKKGMHFSVLKLLGKPVSKFLETYLIKQGFRDGLPGLIISVGAAYSVFLKFAKLWELENQTQQPFQSPGESSTQKPDR